MESFGFKEFASGKNPAVDIVAIHGIDGDRESSWTANNGVLWLRDLLPEKIPNARILSYGYDATKPDVDQLATGYMYDLAGIFISKLALLREETATNNRPIIFVAHSFGGLLLKSALIYSYLCQGNHLKHHHAISSSTHGVAFFGTPQQSLATAALARFLVNTGTPSTSTKKLLKHLERDSEALEQLFSQYAAISAQFETRIFYELYDTGVGKRFTRVVPLSSAILPGVENAAEIGLHKDHIHMVKFPSADDEDFRTISTTLYFMVEAMKAVEKRSLYQSITKEILLTPSQQRALSTLRPVNVARFDADRRPRCLEGTRVGLLGTIAEWAMAREGHQIFWLSGQVGTGKTTISLTVASTFNEKGHLGASFIFSRRRADRRDLDLFPSIAHQLGIFHKPFQKSLAEALERDPGLVHRDAKHQFRKLILEPLKSCSSFPASTIVVIDAIDECKDPFLGNSFILSILECIHELPRLKFFITSRPHHMHSGFLQPLPITRATLLDVDKSVVIADIEHYLHNQFSTSSILYPEHVEPGWPSDGAIKSLAHASGGLFIAAAAAINFILDPTYSDPQKRLSILLEQSPAEFVLLDQLYLQVLRQAFPSKTTPSDTLALLRKQLAGIVLSEPLSCRTLELFLKLQLYEVKFFLRSVITVPDDDDCPILLIHPSFIGFVTSRCPDPDFRVYPPIYHEQLTGACFNQMSGLHRDICNIQDASKLNNEVEDIAMRIKRYISPELQYACNHWAFHLCRAGDGGIHREFLRKFSHGQILYWIEVVSLLGCLREGIRQLQDVSRFFNTHPSPPKDLLEALGDSARFMSDHFELIQTSSLSLYHCALPCSAPSSFLRKTFPSELKGIPAFQEDWKQESTGMTILLGSRGILTSVAFSRDGSLIVSTSGNEIRLWDRGTGTLLKMLKTESELFQILEVQWARISPDGRRVLSGTSEYMIQIWEIATGSCLRTIRVEKVDLESKTRPCYTCSPDFTRVVASKGNKMLVWDTSDAVLLRVLEGHSEDVRFVEFSPDGESIASAADDCSIRIWDTATGATLWTLEGHSERVVTIAFSPSGKHIISASQDNNIRLWDASTGAGLATLIGHAVAVCSIAFSPHEQSILFGSENNTLGVWSVAKGRLLNILKCPHAVRNVGFSPDGTQCIWSMQDTICLLDSNRLSNFKLDQVQLQHEKKMIARAVQRFQDMRLPPGGKTFSDPAQPLAQSQDLGDSMSLKSIADVLPSSENPPRARTETMGIENIEDPPWSDKTPDSVFLLDDGLGGLSLEDLLRYTTSVPPPPKAIPIPMYPPKAYAPIVIDLVEEVEGVKVADTEDKSGI